MVNYEMTKIYILTPINKDLINKDVIDNIINKEYVYIGATTLKYLCLRLGQHKHNFKNYMLNKNNDEKEDKEKNKMKNILCSSFFLFFIYGIDNIKISLLESYKCNNKDEKLKREAFYIKNFFNEDDDKIIVNIKIPGRTIKEYYKDNIDKIKNYKKDYYNDNIDKIKIYKKEYYKNKIKIKNDHNKEENNNKILNIDELINNHDILDKNDKYDKYII
jgi:hypothetical protein